MENYLSVVLFCIGSAFLGAFFLWLSQKVRGSNFSKMAIEIIKKAEEESEGIRKIADLNAKQYQIDQKKEIEQYWQQERKKHLHTEERLKAREDKLESRMSVLEKKLTELEKRESTIAAKQIQIEGEEEKLELSKAKVKKELETIAGLTSNEAKELLLQKIYTEVKTETANFIRRSQKEAEESADQEARRMISTAIQRLAVPCVSETTVNTVSLPNEEMKGRIIGREGRNIRTLEQMTGINFIIDDTPGAVVLSGFDPVRMQVAKTALKDLIQDGRIHPTRIEECVEKAKIIVKQQIKQHGEDAALRAGIVNLHSELLNLLGKLKFRVSYGQNILEHSIEVSHLMGLMASELGLDVHLARRIGLLHDIGKAVSHEIEGSHAIIGHDFALKYGESKEVANGMGCHHFEMDPLTIEGSLCSAADAISASRQGARLEPVEEYVKRLKKLEDLASGFPGVEKAYAMQAGREVRIVVLPDIIDDDALVNLARDVTKTIEDKLHYPGKIKVTLIREKRVIEYAM